VGMRLKKRLGFRQVVAAIKLCRKCQMPGSREILIDFRG